MWQNDLITEPSKHNTNDRKLFTFFKFCYRDGSSEWGKNVGQCSYFATVSAESLQTFPAQPTVATLAMTPPAGTT
jgi:hypothetical protein